MGPVVLGFFLFVVIGSGKSSPRFIHQSLLMFAVRPSNDFMIAQRVHEGERKRDAGLPCSTCQSNSNSNSTLKNIQRFSKFCARSKRARRNLASTPQYSHPPCDQPVFIPSRAPSCLHVNVHFSPAFVSFIASLLPPFPLGSLVFVPTQNYDLLLSSSCYPLPFIYSSFQIYMHITFQFTSFVGRLVL